MKKYNLFFIKTEPFIPDIITGLLWEFDIEGLTEDEKSVIVFSEESSGLKEADLKKKLDELVKQKLIDSFLVRSEELENRNWNKLWEEGREVIKVTNKLVIKPSFKEYHAQADEIVLTIDPKMSFGTGEHATTKLVLKLLEEYIKPGMKILDAGSGTGILAIAAVKLGASAAVAFDNDELCYSNAIENCTVNGVLENVTLLKGEIDVVDSDCFDLITANIQKNILLQLAEKFKEKINDNGIVILSGLLKDDEDEILQYYSSPGFKLIKKLEMDEWIALALIEHG